MKAEAERRLRGGRKEAVRAAAPQQQLPNIEADCHWLPVSTTPPLLQDVRSSELWRKRGAVDAVDGNVKVERRGTCHAGLDAKWLTIVVFV